MTLVSSLEVGCLAIYASPLGEILLLSDGNALTGLYFPSQINADSRIGFRQMRQPKSGRCFDDAKRYLDQYFAKTTIGSVPSLKLSGTRFQMLVWGQLQSISWGVTKTYGEIARAIGKPAASRAVGKAIGSNPISIIVPCHRVIGQSGSLTGYAGGLEIKKWLLTHEDVLRLVVGS